MKTLVYINPTSGQGRAQYIFEECQPVLNLLSSGYQKATDFAALEKCLLSQRPERIVIIGGDGTVHQVLNRVIRLYNLDEAAQTNDPKIEIAVLSAGTGCDLSRSLVKVDAHHRFRPKSAPELKEEIERLSSGVSLPFDVGTAVLDNQQKIYYFNSASIGLGGETHRAQKPWHKKLPGEFSYVLPGTQAVLTYKGASFEVKIDGASNKYFGIATSVMVYNGAYSGGGMVWAHNASVSDGQLNFIWKKRVSPFMIPLEAIKLLSGRVDELASIRFEFAKSVHAISKEVVPAEFDGEYYEAKDYHFNILPALFNVLCSKTLSENK